LKNNHYLIHLPHSGTEIPQEYLEDYFLKSDELLANILEYSDIYTDELFSKFIQKFGGVQNRYSRLFFDPERFGDDSVEEMHTKYKLGWFYENAILEKKPLRTIKNKDKIRTYFDEHHQKLNKLTEEKLELYNRCTIIDCHSFSDERYWFHQDIELPDICIGFEEKHKDTHLIEIIKEAFEGYTIGINKPYKGSLVPTNYWQKDSRVKSVMIEINKKCYLEHGSLDKSSGFLEIQKRLENMLPHF